jgi:Fe-S-cluster containining protein
MKQKGRKPKDESATVLDALIFGAGLQYNFKCAGCGICCANTVDLLVRDHEVPIIAQHLGISEKAFIDIYCVSVHNRAEYADKYSEILDITEKTYEMRNRPCPFWNLATKRCKIYQVRPQTCRSWPMVKIAGGVLDSHHGVITLKPKEICPRARPELQIVEKMVGRLDAKLPAMSPEEAEETRSMGTMYYRALGSGQEVAAPEKNGLLAAISSYIRLRAAGWRFKFDYSDSEAAI